MDRLVDLPVPMLTARAQLGDIERGFETGATDYMVKPFSPLELSARVVGCWPKRAPHELSSWMAMLQVCADVP